MIDIPTLDSKIQDMYHLGIVDLDSGRISWYSRGSTLGIRLYIDDISRVGIKATVDLDSGYMP